MFRLFKINRISCCVCMEVLKSGTLSFGNLNRSFVAIIYMSSYSTNIPFVSIRNSIHYPHRKWNQEMVRTMKATNQFIYYSQIIDDTTYNFVELCPFWLINMFFHFSTQNEFVWGQNTLYNFLRWEGERGRKEKATILCFHHRFLWVCEW